MVTSSAKSVRNKIVSIKYVFFEAFGVAFIFVVTFLHSFVQEDIWFWDEAFYLARGIDPQNFGFPTWADSPSHSLLYSFIHLFTSDAITTYLIGRGFQAAALVASVWVAARLVLKPVYALSAAALMSTIPIIYSWPGVSNIASGLVIVAVVVLLRKRNAYTLGIATLLLWLAATSRPELTYAAALASLFCLSQLFFNWRRLRVSKSRFVTFFTVFSALAFPLLLSLRFGNLLQRFDREWTAFSQHYGLRNSTSGQDVWLTGNDAVQRDFPGASSITQAALENPAAFTSHVMENVLLAPKSFVGNFLGFNAENLIEITVPKIGLILFLAVAFVFIAANWKSSLSVIRTWIHHMVMPAQGLSTILSGVVLLISSVAIFVIYPRAHYQFVAAGLLSIAILLLLQTIQAGKRLSHLPLILIGTVFIFMAFQTLISTPGRLANPPIIEASLRQINHDFDSITIVARDEPITIFLPEAQQAVLPTSATSFAEALEMSNANVIYRSGILDESEWGSLPAYSDFFDDPENFGFTAVTSKSPFLVKQKS